MTHSSTFNPESPLRSRPLYPYKLYSWKLQPAFRHSVSKHKHHRSHDTFCNSFLDEWQHHPSCVQVRNLVSVWMSHFPRLIHPPVLLVILPLYLDLISFSAFYLLFQGPIIPHLSLLISALNKFLQVNFCNYSICSP